MEEICSFFFYSREKNVAVSELPLSYRDFSVALWSPALEEGESFPMPGVSLL